MAITERELTSVEAATPYNSEHDLTYLAQQIVGEQGSREALLTKSVNAYFLLKDYLLQLRANYDGIHFPKDFEQYPGILDFYSTVAEQHLAAIIVDQSVTV